MSSKLHRPGEIEVKRLEWRPARGSAPGIAGPRAVGSEMSRPVMRDANLEEIVDQARQQGYATGEAAGVAVGAARVTERLTPVLHSFDAMVQELASLRARVRQGAETGTVQLAIAIARRVLHREIATDPEAILGLVRSAMERLNARETHRLRVAPSDAAAISEHRSRLNLPPSVEVASDATLNPGSAIFETSRGEVDASVGTQLEEIERGLADVLRRRT